MKASGCFQLVFSSSCTVYGEPTELPITEEHETGNITNVYGRTKYFIEEMLKDISRAEKVRTRGKLFKRIIFGESVLEWSFSFLPFSFYHMAHGATISLLFV
jgi:nucleoside-diphosphate-sugar epimerase